MIQKILVLFACLVSLPISTAQAQDLWPPQPPFECDGMQPDCSIAHSEWISYVSRGMPNLSLRVQVARNGGFSSYWFTNAATGELLLSLSGGLRTSVWVRNGNEVLEQRGDMSPCVQNTVYTSDPSSRLFVPTSNENQCDYNGNIWETVARDLPDSGWIHVDIR